MLEPFDILSGMGRKKKPPERADLFKTIRKPTAPPSERFGPEKRSDKLDPVRRKVKHKQKTEPDPDV